MSDFNGRRYFGYSLHNDPALSTTVRNFEFRYARPEHLERALQKVQLTETANMNQKKTLMLNKYCKMPKEARGVAYRNYDVDVETQMSFSGSIKSRPLSDTEIDQLVGKATSTMALLEVNKTSGCPNPEPNTELEAEQEQTSSFDDQQCYSAESSIKVEPLTPITEAIDEALNMDEFGELPDFFCSSEIQFKDVIDGDEDRVLHKVVTEEYREPIPKWVEIEEGPATAALAVEQVKQLTVMMPDANKSAVEMTMGDEKDHITQQYQMPISKYMPGMMEGGMPEYFEQCHEYSVEDSDLEYEMMGRADYTKLCGPRPDEDELNNVSQEDGDVPHFIQLEPSIPEMNLSFLKNTSPMRYTEVTDEIIENCAGKDMRAYLGTSKANEKKKDDSKMKPTLASLAKKKAPKPKAVNNNTTITKRAISPRSKYSKYSDSPRSGSGNSNQRSKVSSPRQQYGNREQVQYTARAGQARPRKLNASKSLDELKIEKVALFNRMTTSQERIIEIMDKLRMVLLELNIPDNSFEKTKRQKNAFEFTVRFSRNFLYPLKGMIEELKHTPVEHLNSAMSNDACTRLSNTYALLHQALQKYQKQLRYFIMDQVPQKLNVLIEMVYTVNKLSLDKGVFDRHDQITDCLQERCVKFLEFLENLHEERFITARENYRKLNYQRRTQSNYDLKMFMNDLNMYEPKLVPKENARQKRKARKLHAKKLSNPEENSSAMVVNRNNEDSITTQMQDLNAMNRLEKTSAQIIPETTMDMNQDKPEISQNLNRALVEALQSVTKEQVRQVLKPILETIGSALDENRNSEVIENILNVFTNINTTEIKKRCDSKKNRKRTRVPSGKDNCETSSKLSIQSTASASVNVTKQTKLLPQRKAHEASNLNRFATDDDNQANKVSNSKANTNNMTNSSSHNNNNNNNIHVANVSTACGGSATASGGTAGGSISGTHGGTSLLANNIKQKKQMVSKPEPPPSKMTHQQHSTHVETFYEHYKGRNGGKAVQDSEGSSSESEFSDSSSPPDTDMEQVSSLKVTLVNTKSNWRHQSHIVDAGKEKEAAPLPLQSHAAPNISRNATKPRIMPSKQFTGKQSQMSNKSAAMSHGATSKISKQDRKVVHKSSSSSTGHKEVRPHTHRSSVTSARPSDKKSLFKKRRNPMLTPPPVPTVTPNSSARSGADDAMKSARSRFSSRRVNSVTSHCEPIANPMLKHHQMELVTTQIELERDDEEPIAVPLTQSYDESNNSATVLNMMQNHCVAEVLNKCRLMSKENENGQPNSTNAFPSAVLFTNTSPYQRKSSQHPSEVQQFQQQSMEQLQYAQNQQQQQTSQPSRSESSSRPQYLDSSETQSTIQYIDPEMVEKKFLNQHLPDCDDDEFVEIPYSKYQEQSSLQNQQPRKPRFNEIPLDPTEFDNTSNFCTGEINDSRRNKEDTNQSGGDTFNTTYSKRDLNIDSLIRERNHFLALTKRNRFYDNPNYKEPWKTFSHISNKIVNDIINVVEEDFSVGVSKFIQDFLRSETQS